MCKKMSIYETLWRISQQLVTTTDKERTNIYGFGSGFFMQYKEHLFFVTANHVIHPKDEETNEPIDQDLYVSIINNKNVIHDDCIQTIFTPIGDIYTFEEYRLNKNIQTAKDVAQLFNAPYDIPDIAIRMFGKDENFQYDFVTHELVADDGTIIVPHNLPKLKVPEDIAKDYTIGAFSLIMGTVKNDVKDAKFERMNVFYQDLKYVEELPDGHLVLSCPETINLDYWKGLSGSPVMDQKGHIVGMLIEANDINNTIIVLPMKLIKKFMDLVISVEESSQGD